MMKPIALILAVVPVFAQSLLAQSSATYDASRAVKLAGVVTRIEWANPRAFFFVNAQGVNGRDTRWAVEFGNPIELERDGWTHNSLHIGDAVSVEGIAARESATQVFAKSVTLAKTGKKLFVVTARPPAPAPNEPAPRWPDGQIRLGPAPGTKGYWTGGASVSARGNRDAVQMNAEGILRNLADVNRVAPFLPWAKAVYEYRQRTLLKDDPLTRCLPPGGPRQFQMPNGFQFVEQRDLGRILILLGGGDRNWRVIYTDGRPQGQPDEVVRSYYGNSVGKWEKDTLVVDVIGFNEHFWFSNGGLPHTEALHLTERFTRQDLSRMRYDVTIDDPRTYTSPWTMGGLFSWAASQEIQEYFCEENVEATLSAKEGYK